MKSFIVALVVMAVLGLLQRRTQKREQGMLEKVFLIKLSSKFFWFGLVEVCIVVVALFMMMLEGTLSIVLGMIGFLTALPGLLLMILPISGVWEMLVDHDKITVTKCFIFRKHFLFSEITHCIRKRGGSKVYIKGRARKAFFVDAMMDGAYLFEQRIIESGIPIDGVIKEKEVNELDKLSDANMKQITMTLDARNAEDLKRLFSETALKDTKNIDQQLSNFFDFYRGEIMLCDGELDSDSTVEEGVKSFVGLYEILTSKRYYGLRYEYRDGGEIHPEKTGLYKLEIRHKATSAQDTQEDTPWKESPPGAGIYIYE